MGEEVGLEDDTRVDEVEAELEFGFDAPSIELAFGAVMDADLDPTAVDVALADAERSCGLLR